MMERYLEVKRQNPGSILLFRMGDFYELFYDDAKNAARLIGLTLTSRDKGSTNPVPMAGFPYHQLQNYLQKLITSGCRVANRQSPASLRKEPDRFIQPAPRKLVTHWTSCRRPQA